MKGFLQRCVWRWVEWRAGRQAAKVALYVNTEGR